MNASHDALRSQFLSFFAKHGHMRVASSSLVPHGDPSLMFVNAGMVQFKDVFLGLEKRPYSRATTVQKCMRVSGKHNDLEEVGRTRRHHTLFEMLGNFSFGDYFKEEAIRLAWQFISQDLMLNSDKLWITVFGGNAHVPADTEARALWRKISGLPDSRILDKDEKDNFWSMGDVGPCGPCTEIHYDQGTGPVTDKDFDSGRVMEIWNVVFMQYLRQAGGPMRALPKPAVDTGMGLERVAALVAGVDSNYHTDIFMPLIDTVAHKVGKPYGKSDHEDDVSMRVIADHARALSFLVADGVQPSNEGKGYVLRRIMRRAIRHGRRLGFKDVFMPEVTATVVRTMGQAYPELKDTEALIGKVANNEEESFRHTLDGGLKILSEALGGTLDRVAQGPKPVLSGEVVFKLYDTFGFPKDLTETIADERGIAIDHAGFEAAMAEQQARSRAQSSAARASGLEAYHKLVQTHGETAFVGYPHEMEAPKHSGDTLGAVRHRDGFVERLSRVVALIRDGKDTKILQVGQKGEVLFDAAILYAEGGGQVGDTGHIVPRAHTAGPILPVVAEVTHTLRPLPELNVAKVTVTGQSLKVGDMVWVGYLKHRRMQTRAHHSATHLLHHALHRVLGGHVKQAGSLVDADHLRFDFSHFSAVTPQELESIEQSVNHAIASAQDVAIEELHIEEARNKGAVALFGEKYGEQVRVISMGESIEFCGGTHAQNTADLGLLLITREQAVQSGVRRMEAEVGDAALRRVALCRARLARVAKALGDAALASALAVVHEPQDLQADSELDAVLALVNRALSKISELREASGSEDLPVPVVTPQALGTATFRAQEPLQVAQAYALRDTWAALVQLAQGRTQDGPDILQRLGDKDVGHLAAAMVNLLASHKEADRALQALRSQGQAAGAKDLAARTETLPNGIRWLSHNFADETLSLKDQADHLRVAMGSGVVALAQTAQGRVTLLVALTPDLVGRLQAGALIRTMAPHVEGKGGGRPDMAQAGGRKSEGIGDAFAALATLLAQA